VQERYGELRVPVSVLYGKDDRILDWKANGQALVDKVPGARLELVEGGHMLPITQVEGTAAFIETAVDNLSAGTPRGAQAGTVASASTALRAARL
jgi:surfactin synthase thioesterase subunit